MSLADALRRDGRYLAEHYGVYGAIPMVFREAPIALVMAGRAGSSFAVKWFLHHNPVVTDFVWAHRIRVDVVYPSPWHKQRVHEVVEGEPISIVRFTRHPYPRAVSAYLHSLRQARPRGPIAAALGQELDTGYSFAQYLDAMEQLVPNAGCDEHGFLQRTLLDTEKPLTHPYRVEDGPDALRKLELSLDLPPTDDTTYAALRRTNHDHEYLPSTKFLGRSVLDTGRDANRTVQRFETFYDAELLAKVDHIYAEDFDRFGYEHQLG